MIGWLLRRLWRLVHTAAKAQAMPDNPRLLFRAVAEKRHRRKTQGRHPFQELARRRAQAAAPEPVQATADHIPAATVAPTPASAVNRAAPPRSRSPRTVLPRPWLPRRLVRRILIALPVALIALSLVGTVIAFWTNGGSGSASASLGTLTQPGKPSGTDNNGNVDLTWSPSTVSGGGLVRYHVERRNDSGPPWTDACGSTALAPITSASCTDSSVGFGDYVYRVTAIYASWTALSDESDSIHVADASPPDFGSPALTFTGTFGSAFFQYRSGTTIFYNPQSANSGSLTVNAPNVQDPESGIDKVNFPSLTGFSGGGDDSSSPFQSSYSWTSSSSASGSHTVTAYNGDGGTGTTTFTVTSDTTAPTVPAPTVTAGYYTTLSVPVSLGAATDGGSGPDAATITVERDETALVGGVCTPAFPNGWAPVTLSAGNDTSVVSGRCYRYHELQSDNVGNVGMSTASATAKVDTSAPTAPTPTLSNATGSGTFVSGTTVYTNPQAGKSGSFTASASPTDPESAIQKVNFPALTGFTSGGGDIANPGPYATTYNWSGAGATASGSQTVTAHNNASLTNTASFTVTPDTANPTGGAVTANGSSSDSYNTTGTIAIAKTNFTDGGSGIATNVITRATASLAGNSCVSSFSGAVVVPGASDAGLANACYRYTLTGTDNVGNVATALSAIVKVDTTKPVTTITVSPASPNGSNGWYKGPTAPTFTLGATDAHSGVAVTRYQIDAGATQTYSSPVSIPNGTPTISYWSVDNAGNTEVASTTAAIKVDTANPSGSITNPAAGNVVATVALKTTTAADTGGSGVGSVEYFYCSGTSCSPSTSIGTSSTGPDYQFNWDTTALPNGPYVLRATITDAAGNTINTATVAMTINNNYTFVVSNPGPQTAGTAFGGFTIQLQVNGANTPNVGGTPYTGPKTISYSGTATASAPNGTTATSSSSVSFTTGLATVPASAITLVKAATGVVLTVTDGTATPNVSGTSPAFNVVAGTAARLAWTAVSGSGSVPSPCLFTCSWAAFANNGDFKANVAVTDSLGNILTNIGAGHTLTLTRTGDGGTFTAPATTNPITLTVAASGNATTPQFTFHTQNGSWTSDTLTAHVTAGTAYTDATAVLFKN
jgi:hypothetical protein